MAVLHGGGGQNLPFPCMCYPKDPMWNRVKRESGPLKAYKGRKELWCIRKANSIKVEASKGVKNTFHLYRYTRQLQ